MELPSSFISSQLHKISFGIKRCVCPRKRKNSPKWSSKPLQWSPGGFLPVRHVKHIHTDLICCLCFSPPSPLMVSAINLLPVILTHTKKASFRICWKLTIWFTHAQKYYQRAVHLGPSAGWCQDWRWPKARRTESSSERSAERCFPFLRLHDIFLPGGASGSHLRRPRASSMEDLAQQIPISLTGQVGDGGGGEGSSDPQHAPLTALKFTFHAASSATRGFSFCHLED